MMARSRRKPPQREGLGEPSSSVLAVASHLGRRRFDDRQPTSLCIHAWRGRREVQNLAASPTPVGMSEFVEASPHSAALFLTAAGPLPLLVVPTRCCADHGVYMYRRGGQRVASVASGGGADAGRRRLRHGPAGCRAAGRAAATSVRTARARATRARFAAAPPSEPAHIPASSPGHQHR